MADSPEYTYLRVSENNLNYIKDLYLDCFKENVPLGFLKKKYDTSFAGLRDVGFFAMSQSGNPAAYYGVFPVLFTYNEKDILAAQSGDTMTHSEHRGEGLFVNLAKHTYEFAKNNGVEFIFGFPNDQSYRGFVKLNWQFSGYTNKYQIYVTTLPLAKLSQKMTFLKPVYNTETNFFIKKYLSRKSSFDNPLAASDTLTVNRNKNYFNYKSYYPKHLLNIDGHSVWLRTDGSMLVGDIENPEEDSFDKILSVLKSIAFKLGNHKIIFQTLKDSELDKCLSKRFTATEGLAVGWLPLKTDLDVSKIKVSFADFDTF